MKTLTTALATLLTLTFASTALAGDVRTPAQQTADAYWTAKLNQGAAGESRTKVSSESRVIIVRPGSDHVRAPRRAEALRVAQPAPRREVSRHPGVRVTPVSSTVVAPKPAARAPITTPKRATRATAVKRCRDRVWKK